MTDKELADRVVALGVGELDRGEYWINSAHSSNDPAEFVSDWRVAGALMEKVLLGGQLMALDVWTRGGDGFHVSIPLVGGWDSDSLPRAIIEACVTALEPQ